MPTPTYTSLGTITLASTDSECIPFEGCTDIGGYGAKRYQGKTWKAHRLVWTLEKGEIPAGMVIDHTCHNEALAKGECEGGRNCPHRACVNIDHMRLVTQSENVIAGANGFGSRTHCKNGHELTEDNIYHHKHIRTCYTCRLIGTRKAKRAYRAREKAKNGN